MNLLGEFNKIIKKRDIIIKEEAFNFYGDLVSVSPVRTGSFRAAWDIKEKENGWRISNNMEYAITLWNGRRKVGKRWYGSLQWPEGGDPMLQELNGRLQKRLDVI